MIEQTDSSLFYRDLDKDGQLILAAIETVKSRYKVTGLYGLNKLDENTGATHLSVINGNVSYRFWTIGWFEKDNQEKANAAVIIVDSGKQIEPEYLHNDATTLRLETLQGSGKVVVSDLKVETNVYKITTEMESPIEIKPGSVYAVFANGEEPLVLLDYCDPSYKPGMETPVNRDSFGSIAISEEFWTKCDKVVQ